MQILVVGCNGQLGRELMRASWPSEVRVRGLSHADLDITSHAQVDAELERAGAGVVINAAAYTAVDLAESNSEQARRVNAEAPGTLARACAARAASLIHVSTDYVFDGTKVGPYIETDPTEPLGVYGRTKADGEIAIRTALTEHVIVRTSWVFGEFGNNFVKTVLRLAKERDQLRIVADQRGRPTHAADLASALKAVVVAIAQGESATWGTYHYASSGEASWYDVAKLVVQIEAEHSGRSPRVVPITSAEYPTPARRPLNSVFDTSKFERAFGVDPEPWQRGVEQVVRGLLR